MLTILLLVFRAEMALAVHSAANSARLLHSIDEMNYLPESSSCDPTSKVIDSSLPSGPSLEFCSEWNPDFLGNGKKCFADLPRKKRIHRSSLLIRKTRSRCHEMTEDQRKYSLLSEQGQLNDILELIEQDKGKYGDQAYGTVNNGFLAYGRRIVATPMNRILINSPNKCTNFGTDAMVGMIESLGRLVKKKYSEKPYNGVRLVLGDVSGPRGGSHYGPSGRRGHASHTNGQDADIGFLTAKAGKESSPRFTREFNAQVNWWFMKEIFQNPYACVKVIFLDRKHIRSLSKIAFKEPEWEKYKRFIRHASGHKNHLHVRIGSGPGLPGCVPGFRPELEPEDEPDTLDDYPMLEKPNQLKGLRAYYKSEEFGLGRDGLDSKPAGVYFKRKGAFGQISTWLKAKSILLN